MPLQCGLREAKRCTLLSARPTHLSPIDTWHSPTCCRPAASLACPPAPPHHTPPPDPAARHPGSCPACQVSTWYVGLLGTGPLASAGVALSLFNSSTKLLNMPLLAVTTSSVAAALGTQQGERGTAGTAATGCRQPGHLFFECASRVTCLAAQAGSVVLLA